MTDRVDAARACALNEQELWREMVRWSGGRIVEERGLVLVSGPSVYLRVAIRSDPSVDAAAVVARATEFFAGGPTGFIVLVRRPDDEDIGRAALAAGFRSRMRSAMCAPETGSSIPQTKVSGTSVVSSTCVQRSAFSRRSSM
jgi:hypothetical protein